MSIIIRVED